MPGGNLEVNLIQVNRESGSKSDSRESGSKFDSSERSKPRISY